MSYVVLDAHACFVEEFDSYEDAFAFYESDGEAYAIQAEDGYLLDCKGPDE